MPGGASAAGRGYSHGWWPGIPSYREECDVIELRTPGELDAMRAAGAVVADMLAAVRAAAAPGVRLSQLDGVAREVLAAQRRDLAVPGLRSRWPRRRRSPASSACR